LHEVELYPHKIDDGDLAAAVQDLVDISSQRSKFFSLVAVKYIAFLSSVLAGCFSSSSSVCLLFRVAVSTLYCS
jgi:hypothetical protein